MKVRTYKFCPLCKQNKPIESFETYFSKTRDKVRPQSYCIECSPKEKTRRAKEYYQKKGEKVRKYQQKYRRENKELITPKKRKFSEKYRNELHPLYVIEIIRSSSGLSAADIRKVPELIEAEAARIKLVRTLKKKRNEK